MKRFNKTKAPAETNPRMLSLGVRLFIALILLVGVRECAGIIGGVPPPQARMTHTEFMEKTRITPPVKAATPAPAATPDNRLVTHEPIETEVPALDSYETEEVRRWLEEKDEKSGRHSRKR